MLQRAAPGSGVSAQHSRISKNRPRRGRGKNGGERSMGEGEEWNGNLSQR